MEEIKIIKAYKDIINIMDNMVIKLVKVIINK